MAEAGDFFAISLASGDYDGDGHDDLAIGVSGEDVGAVADAGAVNVVHGSGSGLTAAGDQLWHQDTPGVLAMAEAGDFFGHSVASGDFDGDGHDDLAISASDEDVGAVVDAGAVNVLYGSGSGLTAAGDQLWHQDTPGVLGMAEAEDLFGFSLASGDFNGDGHNDLAIGVAGEDVGTTSDAGAVNVFYGSTASLTAAGDQLWHQDTPGVLGMAEAGDVFGFSLRKRIIQLDLARGPDPVLVGAGDISCDPNSSSFNGGNGTATACRMKATSDLIADIAPDLVITMGDNQYEDGASSKFLQSYDLSWGRFKTVIRPSVGNHEYICCADAGGYFAYFGTAAGELDKGYYSYDIGEWHVVVLNSMCSKVGGCAAGSPMEQWLRNDLAGHPTTCTLVYMHHDMLFTAGPHNPDLQYRDVGKALYDYNVDLWLVGHDHNYQRWKPMNPYTMDDDPARGIRYIIVGTGGKNLAAPDYTQGPIALDFSDLEVENHDTFGVLKLALHSTSFDWQFVPEAGKTFTDSGRATCH